MRPACADGLRKETLRKILPTAVRIVVEREGARLRTGSGVVIASRPSAAGSDCYVLTAGHVFTGLTDGEIYAVLNQYRGGSGSRMRADLLAHRESGNLDAAILKIQREAGCVG